ncbi:C6 transcription factor [Phlyctema vagabunda]|uniref:C6 transcription factor n=1 Tax=Phlyctema vagabunda TaxID=108571 RepID=A0ABR4PT62_9HELO
MDKFLDLLMREPSALEEPNAAHERPEPLEEAQDGTVRQLENLQQPASKRPRISSKTPARHQCRICDRVYERADRLTRHLSMHENARRYLCQRCPKSYNRADLLRRHIQTHSQKEGGAGSSQKSIRRTDRAYPACIACAAAKSRCVGQKPCRRCTAKNIACEMPSVVEGAWQQPSADTRPQASGSSMSSHGIEMTLQTPGNMPERHRQPFVHNTPGTEQQLTAQSPNKYPSTIANDSTNHDCAGKQRINPHYILQEPSLASLQKDGMDIMPLESGQLAFDNIIEDIMFMPNIANFNDQSLNLDFHNFTVQQELQTPSLTSTIDETPILELSGQVLRLAHDARASYAAFRRSPWLWTPAQQDYVLHDRGNLTLDEDRLMLALTPISSRLTLNGPNGGFSIITPGMRDKMYCLSVNMASCSSYIPSFPSLEVINFAVEAFFVTQKYQADSWIHLPSMSFLDVIPELGLALVVAGSSVISIAAIWKMGLVLQDVLRIKLGQLWEQDNTATRKLQPLQAYMLMLDAGLWSGFQRQMELAESFVQPIITIMRRGGMFGATSDTPSLIPRESDTGHVLESKWEKWIQRESLKRLCIHLFLHDTRASITLQKYPLISITEITISLPASRKLFLAGTAAEWKKCILEQTNTPPHLHLDLGTVMRDMSILDGLYSQIDVSLCHTAAVYGFWCQIWNFRESWKFHSVDENVDSVHCLWLITQQRELYRQIEAFEHNLQVLQSPQSELLVVIELLLMTLHICPEELQRFAGKYGEEPAFQSLAKLERWQSTESARRAVWHAGQVFRWASMMPPAQLRDFYAIAVYFSSLTLWTFGHLSDCSYRVNTPKGQSIRRSLDAHSSSTKAILIINSEETVTSRSFIAGRQTTLYLTPVTSTGIYNELIAQDDGLVPLNNPNAVLQAARVLYRSNFPVATESLPPLVENMCNLLRDLGSPPSNRYSRSASPTERTSTP